MGDEKDRYQTTDYQEQGTYNPIVFLAYTQLKYGQLYPFQNTISNCGQYDDFNSYSYAPNKYFHRPYP